MFQLHDACGAEVFGEWLVSGLQRNGIHGVVFPVCNPVVLHLPVVNEVVSMVVCGAKAAYNEAAAVEPPEVSVALHAEHVGDGIWRPLDRNHQAGGDFRVDCQAAVGGGDYRPLVFGEGACAWLELAGEEVVEGGEAAVGDDRLVHIYPEVADCGVDALHG